MLSDFKVNGEKDRIRIGDWQEDGERCTHLPHKEVEMTLKISSLMQWSTDFLLLVKVPGLSEEVFGVWAECVTYGPRWSDSSSTGTACRPDDYKLRINTAALSWAGEHALKWADRCVRGAPTPFALWKSSSQTHKTKTRNDMHNKREVQHQIRVAQTIPRAASVCPCTLFWL